ncbi:MAG: P-loop NTPase fold protein [Inquilinus sp.]|uniref:P-loop NTPase fold protein n=1 Tax=Inquilinus sp. TaxID=1932117 RepID=UPI003F2EB812
MADSTPSDAASGSGETAPAALWDTLENKAIDAFGNSIHTSAQGLYLAIKRATRYAAVDPDRREIVLDLRAFLLAMLSIGLGDMPSRNYSSASTWFAEWLLKRTGDIAGLQSIANLGLTDTGALLSALEKGFEVVLSRSVRDAVHDAVDYADRTVGRTVADLRHFFAAMLASRSLASAFANVGWSLNTADLSDLRRDLYDRIGGSPSPREDMPAWQKILGEPQLPPSPRRDFLPSFDDDRPDPKSETTESEEEAKDHLDTEPDITALAQLICLERVTPPLSIGIFGGWGAGKSTFMNRLESRIDELAGEPAEQTPKESERNESPTGTDKFISHVVQIRFNAWQFADANLWASLTAEFFDQLRAGGFARRGGAVHANLVTQVNDHVHQLATTATATREAVAEAEKALVDAQKERDKAVEQVRTAPSATFSRALVETIATAYEKHKPDLVELGRRAYQDNPTKSIDAFVSTAKAAHSIWGQLKLILASVRAGPWRRLMFVAAILLAGLSVWAAVFLNPTDVVNRITAAGGWSALAALGAAAGAVLPGIRAVASIVRSTASFAQALDSQAAAGLKQILQLEAELKAAEAEAAARREAAARANKALARYVDPDGASNPPRLLRYVLEDDPDTKAIDREIGLIGRARRLFQAVDAIVAAKPCAADNAHQSVPDRIVLYIDDLDRCTHRQVYEVLQAIHLLLAFRLFVVVVAVDVAWIQAALAAQTEMGMPADPAASGDADEAERRKAAADVERRKRAIAYLEKIFQLPFWLRPLNTDGRDGGSYRAFVQDLLEPNKMVEDSKAATIAYRRLTLETAAPAGIADAQDGGDAVAAPAQVRETRAEALDAALTAVKLTQEEIDFLASPAIGAIAPRTPRGAKRLANVYRLVRARMNNPRSSPIPAADAEASRPIVALLVAIETGQPVEVADPLYEGLKTSAPETDIIEVAIHPEVQPSDPGPLALWLAFRACPALEEAVIKVMEARGDRPSLTVGDCLPVARLVRRYSFNRYQ